MGSEDGDLLNKRVTPSWLLQGSIFWRTGVDTEESFWDTAEDAKFEVKEPEAKKSKKEEEEEWSSV